MGAFDVFFQPLPLTNFQLVESSLLSARPNITSPYFITWFEFHKRKEKETSGIDAFVDNLAIKTIHRMRALNREESSCNGTSKHIIHNNTYKTYH